MSGTPGKVSQMLGKVSLMPRNVSGMPAKVYRTPRNLGYNFRVVGEVFEGKYADACAEKYFLMLMGAEWRVLST